MVLASSMCCLGSVCSKGTGQLERTLPLPMGCSLQPKLREGMVPGMQLEKNHLMLRLAENNLPSSPSWLMLLAFSPLLLLCLLPGTPCLYYWCSTFSVLFTEASFHCKRTSGSTSVHSRSRSQCLSAWLLWAPLCKVQRQFLIRLLLV